MGCISVLYFCDIFSMLYFGIIFFVLDFFVIPFVLYFPLIFCVMYFFILYFSWFVFYAFGVSGLYILCIISSIRYCCLSCIRRLEETKLIASVSGCLS